MKYLLYCLLFFTLTNCNTGISEWEVESPDKKIKATVFIKRDTGEVGNGRLFYKVEILKGNDYEKVINPSPLGLLTNEEDLSSGFITVINSKTRLIDEKYEMFSGKQRSCHNLANEISLTFATENNAELLIRFRAYNDGIAFKYEIPGKDGEKRTIEKEETGFSIPSDAVVWISPYDIASPTTPAYETLHTNGSKAGEEAPKKQGWAFPALFKSNEVWLFISEAGVYDNYCGSHLQPKVENGIYKIRLPEMDERYGEGESKPTSSLPWEMPWRFIIIGTELNTIVQSNMSINLSEPCRIEDTGWIKTGRSSWSWWSSRIIGRKLDTLKQYADLSKEMGWEYTLVDAFWEDMKGGTVEEFIEYSNNRNVGVWLWYNSGGRRDPLFNKEVYIMEDSILRKQEMKRIHELGVKGIKVDFFCSDKQDVIKLYLDILKDAADYELLVNFHGCTLPRGWRRTYPNLLSMEAIKGAECYRYDEDFTENAPWHNTIAFFVRNTVGPMDYTPVTFSNQTYPHNTTYGHELAGAVLFESGIVHMADKAESYKEAGSEVRQFLSGVPVSWEETRLIDGYPGKFAVVARKSKENVWYIAGINGEKAEKKMMLKFDFLEEGNNYSMDVISDETPTSFRIIEHQDIETNDSIEIAMLPMGGFVCVSK